MIQTIPGFSASDFWRIQIDMVAAILNGLPGQSVIMYFPILIQTFKKRI